MAASWLQRCSWSLRRFGSRLHTVQDIPRCCYASSVSRRHFFSQNVERGATSQLQLACLKERAVFRVRGKDAPKFLQGLITNDINWLSDSSSDVIYAHLLHENGRTLYDVLIFRNNIETLEFLVECDLAVIDDVVGHLKRFKLRSKVEMIDATKEVSSWALFYDKPSTVFDIPLPDSSKVSMIANHDPRTSQLGLRMLTPWNQSPKDLMMLDAANVMNVDTVVYSEHRYRLGVAEGQLEIESGSALPLQANLDLMNGVSFTKGCYLGQELTARSHHTGVIRKRIVPLQVQLPTDFKTYPTLPAKCPLKSDSGRPLGSLIAGSGRHYLGLVRLGDALKAKEICAENDAGKKYRITMSFPNWWPEEILY